MINRVVVFIGSRKSFEEYLAKEVDPNDRTIPFMELIQHYNARIRPSDSGVRETGALDPITIDNCIVRLDDYGSVLDHVLPNFVNIVSLNHNIENLFVQNPPKRVLHSLESACSDIIEYVQAEYQNITRVTLKRIYRDLIKSILGQDSSSRQVVSGLYRLSTQIIEKPVVLLFYGASGVGKTETAKCISKTLGGELLRVQFSMMQTNEAYNYVFGAEHSKSSLARDILARESNVILIDEFDKVSPIFYNAFYELFDEGRFVDSNYEVQLKKTIFICTSNFMSEHEIRSTLGPAMFSRIGCCIKFEDISVENKHTIIRKWYKKITSKLSQKEREIVFETDILEWFLTNAERYDNIRTLQTKMENAVFDTLTDEIIIAQIKNTK